MHDKQIELNEAAIALVDFDNPRPNGFPWYLSDWTNQNSWECSVCGAYFHHAWWDGSPRMEHESNCPVPRLEAAAKAFRE